jgi:NitT/TauT family transport system permease protein
VVEAGGNRWDWALLPIVLAVFVLMAYGSQQMARPMNWARRCRCRWTRVICRTTCCAPRCMFIAMGASVVFSCVFAALTTKYRRRKSDGADARHPAIDPDSGLPVDYRDGVYRAVPRQSAGVECGHLRHLHLAGVEYGFSAYQGFRTVPAELSEAAQVFQLSGWQRFWRLELPFAMPGLLWNMMMSMSGGWFFVVASEAIMVSNQTIKLPGMGSYIALAIEQSDLGASAGPSSPC